MRTSGADTVICLGGVQALGALAFGRIVGVEPGRHARRWRERVRRGRLTCFLRAAVLTALAGYARRNFSRPAPGSSSRVRRPVRRSGGRDDLPRGELRRSRLDGSDAPGADRNMNDRWSLNGRVAIVTGAGRGIGQGCARALAQAGADVLLVARSANQVRAAAREVGGHAYVADVTDETQVQQIIDAAAELGDVRVLVNSAGTNRIGPTTKYSLTDWDALFEVNVRGTFLACRAFGTALIARGASGSIVNLSSQLGVVGYPGRVAYCATKHAVEGMTKALGVEWAPNGIRVNAVAPTYVLTALTESLFRDEAFTAEVMGRLPTQQLATIEQVADAVRYLACDASGSVTGTVLRVDGGWTAW